MRSSPRPRPFPSHYPSTVRDVITAAGRCGFRAESLSGGAWALVRRNADMQEDLTDNTVTVITSNDGDLRVWDGNGIPFTLTADAVACTYDLEEWDNGGALPVETEWGTAAELLALHGGR